MKPVEHYIVDGSMPAADAVRLIEALLEGAARDERERITAIIRADKERAFETANRVLPEREKAGWAMAYSSLLFLLHKIEDTSA